MQNETFTLKTCQYQPFILEPSFEASSQAPNKSRHLLITFVSSQERNQLFTWEATDLIQAVPGVSWKDHANFRKSNKTQKLVVCTTYRTSREASAQGMLSQQGRRLQIQEGILEKDLKKNADWLALQTRYISLYPKPHLPAG